MRRRYLYAGSRAGIRERHSVQSPMEARTGHATGGTICDSASSDNVGRRRQQAAVPTKDSRQERAADGPPDYFRNFTAGETAFTNVRQIVELHLRILSAAAYGYPFEEAFDAGTLSPHQPEEFSRVEFRGFFAEERFHAPLNVWRSPRAQTIATGDNPVVAQGVQHGTQTGQRTRRPLAAMEAFLKVRFRRNGRIETFAGRLLR